MTNISKEDAIELIKTDPLKLSSLRSKFRDDFDVVLVAVEKNGRALEYASSRLHNDRHIVFSAVNNFGTSLKYASDDLRDDKDLVLIAVKSCASALVSASDKLKNDRDVVFTAIKKWGGSLQYASTCLCNDKEVVLSAVTECGTALLYAGDTLRFDFEIILTSIHNDMASFAYCHGSIRNTPIIRFMLEHKRDLSDFEWPIIKKALLEKPDYFLNPEPYMRALTDGMAYPYLLLAQYALNKDLVVESEELPDGFYLK